MRSGQIKKQTAGVALLPTSPEGSREPRDDGRAASKGPTPAPAPPARRKPSRLEVRSYSDLVATATHPPCSGSNVARGHDATPHTYPAHFRSTHGMGCRKFRLRVRLSCRGPLGHLRGDALRALAHVVPSHNLHKLHPSANLEPGANPTPNPMFVRHVHILRLYHQFAGAQLRPCRDGDDDGECRSPRDEPPLARWVFGRAGDVSEGVEGVRSGAGAGVAG